VVSYAVAGLSALLSSLCYAEFAVNLPMCGGAYRCVCVERDTEASAPAGLKCMQQGFWISWVHHGPPVSLRVPAAALPCVASACMGSCL
jgi:hypothetical protein